MKSSKPITASELSNALGAFLICFGQGLPQDLRNRIQERTYQTASLIEQNGQPTVARLARGLADALATQIQPPIP